MIQRRHDPIPAFIPVHQPEVAGAPYRPSPPKTNGMYLNPLSTQEPMLMLTGPVEQIRTEMRQASNDMACAV